MLCHHLDVVPCHVETGPIGEVVGDDHSFRLFEEISDDLHEHVSSLNVDEGELCSLAALGDCFMCQIETNGVRWTMLVIKSTAMTIFLGCTLE